jgi:hypothetical protein
VRRPIEALHHLGTVSRVTKSIKPSSNMSQGQPKSRAWWGAGCSYRLLDRRNRFAELAPNHDIDCSSIVGDHIITAAEQSSNDVHQRARIDADIAIKRNRRAVSQIERRLEGGQDVRNGIFVYCDVDRRQRYPRYVLRPARLSALLPLKCRVIAKWPCTYNK